MSRLSPALACLALAPLLAPASPAGAGDVTLTLPAGEGFSVRDNTGAVERLRVDESTGNVSRNGALFVHTTGTANTFVGAGAGNLGTTGALNTAVGVNALSDDTTGGSNSAFGRDALRNNTLGSRNSAFGEGVLVVNTTGTSNSAFGSGALQENTDDHNSAFGFDALRDNTTGFDNSAVGSEALSNNTTGARNVAVGANAGDLQTTGNDNVYLANRGVAGENGQIKIGTAITHTRVTVAGIHGSTSSAGVAVLVNASGVLGTSPSSARFKQDVRDMGEASDVLERLRPVVFRYREEGIEGGGIEYGLIAEEVAEVAPELVSPDLEGRPYSVRYHVLPALLLNELQEQQRTIDALLARVAELERRAAGAAPAGPAR
jgi:hypothetical protein